MIIETAFLLGSVSDDTDLHWKLSGYRKGSLIRQYIAVFTGGTNPEFVSDAQ